MKKTIKNFQYIFILSTLCYLASCTAPTKKTYFGQATLRIVNAVPENYNLTLFVNDTSKTPTPLKFTDFSAHQNVMAGTSTIYTKSNGNVINRSDLTFLFLPKENYTIFIAGKISKDSLSYISFKDSLNAPIQGQAKVRLINTSYNSASLDAIFSNRSIDSLNTFGNIGFRSGNNYLQFKPGVYFIKLRQTGSKNIIFTKSNIEIKAGKIYTLWAKGLINGNANYSLDVGVLNDN
ncbi:DUF4397 domain-containing protein [Pedobacter sp. SD-b]|uniref:DUF4397 domain-containing protein n=1 Tax=Pedobacter segetis TaxID=2793069 RepID=A0ABS1BMS9_9SPHI|nr:DUF4397 domain-containing protein [Pedobacter segetis]MBK0384194.1 DUF4397 domain-containing protein [Pedobacter segetis]